MREREAARREEAVAAYRDALKERTCKRVPLGWARTQGNLGNALQTLGEHESETARLEEAVDTYREVLKERIRERVPLEWPMTLGNQGVAMVLLAERTKNAMMAETGGEQIEVALETTISLFLEPVAHPIEGFDHIE